MKIFLLFTFLSIISILSLNAQCSGEFFNQSDVDNFAINCPGLDSLPSFMLHYSQQDPITNLDGLSNVRYIGGDVYIEGFFLTDISGLNNVERIKGDLSFWGYDSMRNMDAFTSLVEINGNLIIDRTRFDTISGFGSIEKIDLDIFICDNWALQVSEPLGPINNVRSLYLDDNYRLLNLTCLSNFDSVGYLYIAENNAIKDFSGLNNLRYVETLKIDYNESLENLVGLENLETIVEFLHIIFNPILKSIESLESLKIEEIEEVSICSNDVLSLCCIDNFNKRLIGPKPTLLWSNASGCDSETDILNDCASVSVSEYLYESTLFVTPNPVRQTLFVDRIKNFNYEIVDMQGKVNEKGKSLSGEIYVSHLIPAVYVCHIMSETGSYNFKFVKQ
jgi:hypothetical protein